MMALKQLPYSADFEDTAALPQQRVTMSHYTS
jgi:hypothetical protein